MSRKTGFYLLIIVLAAFWQVAFLQNSLKWDFIDAFLPSRYFFSESILNNQIPLWNPYLLYGIPLFGDLVSVFNPEFWLISNIFGYSNITLQWMYLVYVFIAGLTFNSFLKNYNLNQYIRTGLSIAYMLSGVTVGNAQNLAVIIGFALLPIVVLYYLKFLKHLNLKTTAQFVFTFVLMIYMSYPALTIISVYFLLCFSIFYLIKDKKYKSFFKYHAIASAAIIASSSVLILSYIQVSPFLNQYSGVDLNFAQQHPFTPQSLLSFLFPMSTGVDNEFWGTDISMSNGYFGIVSLVLLFFSFSLKVKNKESYVFLGFAIFSLLVSFGNHFFLREFLFDYVPLFDLFRYPSLFRVFVIFSLLAYVGINFTFNKKKLLISAFLVLGVLLFFIFWSFPKVTEMPYFDADLTFAEESRNASFYDNILFQAIIQVAIILSLILALAFIKKENYLFKVVFLLFIIDGITSVQLNINYSVIGNINPIEFKSYLDESPKGFPNPSLTPLKNNSDQKNQNEFVWVNANVFPKKPTFDGMVSFRLDGYNKLETEYKELFELIKENPILYFSDEVYEEDRKKAYNHKTLLIDGDVNSSVFSSLKCNSTDKLEIISYQPKELIINTETQDNVVLAFQQNYFTGWRVFVDGIEQEIFISNFAHMAVFLEKGQHQVVFKYENKAIIYALFFTTFLIFVLALYLLFQWFGVNPKYKLLTILILLLIILLTIINRYSYNRAKDGLKNDIISSFNEWKKNYNKDIYLFLSSPDKLAFEASVQDTIVDISNQKNIASFSNLLKNVNTPYFSVAWHNTQMTTETEELALSFYPKILQEKKAFNSGFLLLGKDDNKIDSEFRQTFDNKSSFWSSNSERISLDTITNNKYFSYHANQVWGSAFEYHSDDTTSYKKIIFICDILTNNKMIDIPFVFTIERDQEAVVWKSKNISDFICENRQWSRAVLSFDFPKLEKNDKIKAYFWNKNAVGFHIDNLDVKFLE